MIFFQIKKNPVHHHHHHLLNSKFCLLFNLKFCKRPEDNIDMLVAVMNRWNVLLWKKTKIWTSIWIKIDEFHNPKKVIKKKNDNEYFFYIMCDKMFNWIKWIDLLWRTNIILFLYYDFYYLYMAIYNLSR